MIRQGGAIAYPTESFYALGADATNVSAVKKIFRMKGRRKKPIGLIAADFKQVKKFFFMTRAEERLARKYWPGALTILLRPKKAIAARALLGTTPSGRMTGHPSLEKEGTLWSPRRLLIGVRVPAHAQARALALYAGVPLTATSANLSGQAPTKSPKVVQRLFPARPVLTGRCGKYRQPSTVVTVKRGQAVVLRRGQVKM